MRTAMWVLAFIFFCQDNVGLAVAFFAIGLSFDEKD